MGFAPSATLPVTALSGRGTRSRGSCEHREMSCAVELRVAVLSDTHLRGGIERLPSLVLDEIDRADVLLHAGDVLDGDALDALTALVGDRPFHAVLGNNDHQL